MNNPHEIDQGLAGMRDLLPRVWRQLYMGCLDKGFTAEQSFALLQTYILSQNPNGIVPPRNSKDDKPEET